MLLSFLWSLQGPLVFLCQGELFRFTYSSSSASPLSLILLDHVFSHSSKFWSYRHDFPEDVQSSNVQVDSFQCQTKSPSSVCHMQNEVCEVGAAVSGSPRQRT